MKKTGAIYVHTHTCGGILVREEPNITFAFSMIISSIRSLLQCYTNIAHAFVSWWNMERNEKQNCQKMNPYMMYLLSKKLIPHTKISWCKYFWRGRHQLSPPKLEASASSKKGKFTLQPSHLIWWVKPTNRPILKSQQYITHCTKNAPERMLLYLKPKLH